MKHPLQPRPARVRAYEEVFTHPPDLAGEPIGGGPVFLCFTNRSGSSYLAECLRATGHFDGPKIEAFRPEVMATMAPQLGAADLAGYCRALHHEWTANGKRLLVKIGTPALFHLHDIGVLDAVFHDPVFVWIRRNDLLAQAVSHAVALQTGQWRSDRPAQLGTRRRTDYSTPSRLYRRVTGLALTEARLRTFFAVSGHRAHEFVYERFSVDSTTAVEDFLHREGLEVGPEAAPPVTTRRQATARNTELASRARAAFVADPSAFVHVDVGDRSVPRSSGSPSVPPDTVLVAGPPTTADRTRHHILTVAADTADTAGATDVGRPGSVDDSPVRQADAVLDAVLRAGAGAGAGAGVPVVTVSAGALEVMVARGDLAGAHRWPRLVRAVSDAPAHDVWGVWNHFETQARVQLLAATFPFTTTVVPV